MTGPRSATTSRWEVFRAVGALAEHPSRQVAWALGIDDDLDPADHTEVFAFHALPYASAYLGGDGMLGGEAAARVAGFWRAVGYTDPQPPDHLAALLGLYAGLGESHDVASEPARRKMLDQARQALLWEHLLPWVGVFADVVRMSGVRPWEVWADLIGEVMEEETARIATDDGLAVPRHLAEAPPPIDEDHEIAHLLAPVRSGIVLTRRDLSQAGRAMGLGIRMTGRLPTLEALLGQEPRAISSWLADHARQWEEQHRDRPGPALINRFWAERAARTATVLGQTSGTRPV